MVRQRSQGNCVLESRHDILVEAIGRPEHWAHVRAAEKGVRIKQYFRATPRHSSFSTTSKTKAELTNKIRQELMEEMRKETERVRLEYQLEFLSQEHCAELLEPHVSLAPKSTKGSYATPITSEGMSLAR